MLKRFVAMLRSKNIIDIYVFRFLVVSGVDNWVAKNIINLLKKENCFFSYVSYDIRHPHGYMRLKKPRRL